MQKSKHVKGPRQPLTPKARDNELRGQLKAVRLKLDDMQSYKRLIAADGQKADFEDKRLETELIRRVLWLEKQLKGTPQFKKPADFDAKPAAPASSRRGRNAKPSRAPKAPSRGRP